MLAPAFPHFTSGLPFGLFGVNLTKLFFHKYRLGFIDSGTAAFGWPTIAVDTHTFRVSNRTGLAPSKNVDVVEQKQLKVVPVEFKVDVHHWLISHGRYTYIARKPRCGSCLIEDLCEYSHKPAMTNSLCHVKSVAWAQVKFFSP